MTCRESQGYSTDSDCELLKFAKRRLLIGHRPGVDAPGFQSRINLGRLHKSAVDPKSIAMADANDLVTNARIGATTPALLVDRCVAFTGNLPVIESVVPEPRRQCFTGMTFLTPSLSHSARFLEGDG